MNPTDLIDAQSLRDDIPEFQPGDTVRVHVRVVEGNRARTQLFEGVVMRRQGSGVRETFTVRKVSFGVGRGADVPRAHPVDRSHRARHAGRCAPSEAVLPARPRRQGGQGQGKALSLTGRPVRRIGPADPRTVRSRPAALGASAGLLAGISTLATRSWTRTGGCGRASWTWCCAAMARSCSAR